MSHIFYTALTTNFVYRTPFSAFKQAKKINFSNVIGLRVFTKRHLKLGLRSSEKVRVWKTSRLYYAPWIIIGD